MKTVYTYLFVVLFLALLFRVVGIPGSDVNHDAAINAVRAYGWFDFLDTQTQTSPISWFGEIPSWANLSFHDHPPLVFFIQKVFFSIFPDNTTTALLPFIVSGVLITWLIYLMAQKFYSQKTALLVTLLFSISSYAVWISRSGYLEGVQLLFIVLAAFFALRVCENKKTRDFYFLSASVAFALLSKYTAIFLIPTIAVFFFIKSRGVFKNKHFWLSLLVIPIILSPVIIYNYQVFRERGHFDAALSSMVGMHPKDFNVISERGVNANILDNAVSVGQSLFATSSIGFLLLFLAAIIFAFSKVVKKNLNNLEALNLLAIAFIVVMFLFSGAQARFLSIIVPFLIMLFASVNNISKKVFFPILVAVILFEGIYSVNTNLLAAPLGAKNILYSSERFYQDGFNEVEKFFLQQGVFKKSTPIVRPKSLEDLLRLDIAGKEVILLDESTNWFSRNWHLNRYFLYHDVPMAQFRDVIKTLPEGKSITTFLKDLGATGVWIVFSEKAQDSEYAQVMQGFIQEIKNLGIEPAKQIQGFDGMPSFSIYHLII